MILNKGDTFKENRVRSLKYHVVETIEDKGELLLIIKYYGRRKQWWHYEIKHLWDVIERFNCGLYNDYKKAKVS